jgi:RNA ligase (TIGR02306 family)
MGTEIQRKLASIQRIDEIRDIEGADAIQAYRVLGWWVVDKKHAHKVGDLVVYLCIDSWVPHELAPFLSKGSEPREYNGVKGERLRTIRLRGQISQGLLLSLESVGITVLHPEYEVGLDLTKLLGIQKWEPALPAQLVGKVRGLFPTNLVPKTDQERCQNIWDQIQDRTDVTYEVSLKLDGTSCTIFRWEGELRVCSRNLELKVNDENRNNTLVAMALKLEDRIPNGFAFQGELMGEGIQGNREGFKGHRFFVFDVYDIENQKYLVSADRLEMVRKLNMEHVPIVFQNRTAPDSVDLALELAEGPSINHRIREGLVWKCNTDPGFSFKTISNTFLLKNKD